MTELLAPVLPLRQPAQATFEYRLVLTWPTSDFLRLGYDAEELQHGLADRLFLRCAPNVEAHLVTSKVERRFEVVFEDDGWRVWDHVNEDYIATFDLHKHADHYADALERKPELVDDDA